ncbi:MAG: peptidoglycan bridge formation glycyltransferase FemA/FemB family protein [Anaerolineae bacterium]|nr:peptidoglycan bridge formation glycyltransferase FemA/FemB family protein [Anaerolineae bacterium]
MEAIAQADVWDAALRTLPQVHFLQSWLWGELKGSRRWNPSRFLWRVDGRVVAAAQVLVLQRGRLRLGYVPKGPLLDWTDQALAEAVLTQLAAYAQQHGLLLLKIDPDVRADTEVGSATSALLTRQGWRASFEQVQFRNTMLLDLHPALDQLMAQMKPKWRYNIHLAVRKGVVIRDATLDDFPLLCAMYAETATRDSFVIREEAYYQDVWQRFMRAGLTWALIAEIDNTPVAMAIAFHLGSRAWYMYGASRDTGRSFMPNHLLQWHIIRRAKEAGCTVYDLWGAPDTLDVTDPLWGVYRFKEGFGATFVRHLGAYDYTPRTWLYRLYAFLRPRAVAMAHRYYWARIRYA